MLLGNTIYLTILNYLIILIYLTILNYLTILIYLIVMIYLTILIYLIVMIYLTVTIYLTILIYLIVMIYLTILNYLIVGTFSIVRPTAIVQTSPIVRSTVVFPRRARPLPRPPVWHCAILHDPFVCICRQGCGRIGWARVSTSFDEFSENHVLPLDVAHGIEYTPLMVSKQTNHHRPKR